VLPFLIADAKVDVFFKSAIVRWNFFNEKNSVKGFEPHYEGICLKRKMRNKIINCDEAK